MNESEFRLAQLHQIPVFALQKHFVDISQTHEQAETLLNVIQDVLGKEPRMLDRAIGRLSRAELNKIIDASPELLTDDDLCVLFEAYRYGVSPSFCIYQLTSIDLSRVTDIDELECRIETYFKNIDPVQDSELALAGITLNSLSPLPEQGGILEANYHYLKRLDYIDACLIAVSTYETKFGFFWINLSEGYAIVQRRSKDVLKYLRNGIERSLGTGLVELVISEELQKELPFLDPEKIQLGLFKDSDPESENFPTVKVTNSARHNRQFEKLRETYPEMPQANYGDTAVNGKRTTISVYARGVLKAYGRFTATQIRHWCFESVGQIVDALTRFHRQQAELIATLNIDDASEYSRLSCNLQKDLVKQLVSTLVAFKKLPGIGVFPLNVSPLFVAATFGDLVKVQIPFFCQDVACEVGHYFVCPTCGNRNVTIVERDGWIVDCENHPMFPLNAPLPLVGECDNLYHYSLDTTDISGTIEIFLGRKLEGIIQDLINNIGLDDCLVDFNKEFIYISGTNVVYHPNRDKAFGAQGDSLTKNIYGDNYEDVLIAHSPGSGVGRRASGHHAGSADGGGSR